MPTRRVNPTPNVLVADWKPPLPEYVKWLHHTAIRERAADEYTAGHIAGFKIGPTDRALNPILEDVVMVYLVYKERKHANPAAL